MENEKQFQGVCPLCYKPVRSLEDFRTLQGEGRNETYHAACLHQFIQYNSAEGKKDASLGLSLLEQYKGLMLPSVEKRESWISENKYNWLATGQILREERETYGIALKHVAAALDVSIARLKRFEAGEPVRDAKLLLSGYSNLLYIYQLEFRLKRSNDLIEENQIQIERAINNYVQLQNDMQQLSLRIRGGSR